MKIIINEKDIYSNERQITFTLFKVMGTFVAVVK